MYAFKKTTKDLKGLRAFAYSTGKLVSKLELGTFT